MTEHQRAPERTRESELFGLLAASYEFSQKDGHLQKDLMRVFRYLHPNTQTTEADIARFIAEGQATRTDYAMQQQPTVAMRMVKMINNVGAHKELESGLASMRLELPHWEDYFAAFIGDDATDPCPTPEAACAFILKLIAQDEHYARVGRERNRTKVYFDYCIDHIFGDQPLRSGNTIFSRETLPLFRGYIHRKLQEMPHELFTQIQDAVARLAELHNQSPAQEKYDAKSLRVALEKIRHAPREARG
jgi:hypothetical protein